MHVHSANYQQCIKIFKKCQQYINYSEKCSQHILMILLMRTESFNILG